MKSGVIFTLLLLCSLLPVHAQERSQDDQAHITPRNMPKEKEAPPQPQGEGDSSSKDSQIDLNRKPEATEYRSSNADDVQEMYPYDPHKAAKDIEVGEYYLKTKNYRAALDRFQEALLYKPRDAEAIFRLAQTQEKLELFTPAYKNYRLYLEIFPGGPFAKEADQSANRLEPKVESQRQSPELQRLLAEGEQRLARNDFEGAHTDFVEAIQIVPDDPLTNFRLAQSLQGLQRLDEARIFYRKCVDLQPNGPQAREAKKQIGEINLVLGK
jgi:Flp pilus assembly protein TadD